MAPSCGASTSRSRRLRDIAVKHKLYEKGQMFDACAKGETCKTTEMLNNLSCKLENLEHVIQGKLEFLISCFCIPAYQYPASEYIAELDQGDEVLSYLNPYATDFKPSVEKCSASSAAAQAYIRADATVLTKDVLLENRNSESSHDDLINVIFCQDCEQGPDIGEDLSGCGSASGHADMGHRHWQPISKPDFFNGPCFPHVQLREEASIVIQRFFRKYLDAGTSGSSTHEEELIGDAEVSACNDTSSEPSCEETDDNSPEAVGIRRAFMTSTCSVKHAPPRADHGDFWTYERILFWIDITIDLSLQEDDRSRGARVLWREWSAIESHIPPHIRTKIVQVVEAKVLSIGFPSLRELVGE